MWFPFSFFFPHTHSSPPSFHALSVFMSCLVISSLSLFCVHISPALGVHVRSYTKPRSEVAQVVIMRYPSSDCSCLFGSISSQPRTLSCPVFLSRLHLFPESICEGFLVKRHLQNYVSSTSSHLHLYLCSCSHLHIYISAHLHICTSTSLLIFIFTYLHLCSCSHLHIYISAHLHILTSSLLIFTSSRLQLTSSPLALLNFLS